MDRDYSITLRTLCASLGIAYAAEAMIALAGLGSTTTSVIAFAIAIFGYANARTLDGAVAVPLADALRNSKVALILLGLGLISIVIHTESSLPWVCIVHAYCAGNRLKAADLRRSV